MVQQAAPAEAGGTFARLHFAERAAQKPRAAHSTKCKHRKCGSGLRWGSLQKDPGHSRCIRHYRSIEDFHLCNSRLKLATGLQRLLLYLSPGIICQQCTTMHFCRINAFVPNVGKAMGARGPPARLQRHQRRARERLLLLQTGRAACIDAECLEGLPPTNGNTRSLRAL